MGVKSAADFHHAKVARGGGADVKICFRISSGRKQKQSSHVIYSLILKRGVGVHVRTCYSCTGMIASCVQMCLQKPGDSRKGMGGAEFSQCSVKFLVMTSYSFLSPSPQLSQRLKLYTSLFAAHTPAFQCFKQP